MEAWEKAFREGIAPQFNDRQLSNLLAAINGDDISLIQGATTSPPPLMCVQDWPTEAACAVAFMCWDDDAPTVGTVEEKFAKAIDNANIALGVREEANSRYFLNWWDETPRFRAFRELAAVITDILHERQSIN